MQVALTPMTPKHLVRTSHGHFYNMSGFHQGRWFQNCMQHGVAPSSKICGARLSLTYRLTSRTATRLGLEPVITKPLILSVREHFMAHLSFDSIFQEVSHSLEPDISFSRGMWHVNHGRLAGALMDERYWADPNAFRYSYGKKILNGKPMGPLVREMCAAVISATGQVMDWVHVTYYPMKQSKLGTHSDSEPAIAYGTDIACLTFMQHEGDERDVYVIGNDAPRTSTTTTTTT